MKRPILLLMVLVCSCSSPMEERATANAGVHATDITDTLQIRVQGGAIWDQCEREFTEDSPEWNEAKFCQGHFGARIRSQSLDTQIEIQDRGCKPTLLAIEVEQAPRTELTVSYRVFLDALSPEVGATRGVLAGGFGLEPDPHDATRTPIGPETADITLQGEADEPVRRFGVCIDRGRRRVEMGSLATLRASCSAIEPASLCTASGTESSPPLEAAALVMRIRLRNAVTEKFSFATWGNINSNLSVQEQIIESVKNCRPKPRFAVVSGDLSHPERENDFASMATALRAQLDLPWFGTLGDKDLEGDIGDEYLQLIGASSFAMDLGALRLIVLDSANAGLSSRDHRQLDAWLGMEPLWWAGDPVPAGRLVITHIPPFDPIPVRGDAFRSRGEAARLVASLQRKSVGQVVTSQWTDFAVQRIGNVEFIDGGGGGATRDGQNPYWLLVDVDPGCSDERRPTCPGTASGAPCPCITVTPIPLGEPVPPACASSTATGEDP